jgi:hypothetical protein
MTPISLAKMLKPFKIFSQSVRVSDGTPKGYRRDDFSDAWDRYLPKADSVLALGEIKTQHSTQVNIHAGPGHFSETQQKDNVAPSKSEESPISMRVVPDVAFRSPDTREKKPARTLPSCPVCQGYAIYKEPTGVMTCMTCVSRDAN